MIKQIKFFFSRPEILISLILFLIPFFWIKPGEANMGGDGGSLYYYDPISFIKHYIIFNIYPFGTGPVEIRSFYLPFVSVIAFIQSIYPSPYLISALHTGIKLSVGFFAIFLVVKEILLSLEVKPALQVFKIDLRRLVSIISGLFYIFSPILTQGDRFINPIPSHDQVFLNPLLFYLMLKFLITRKLEYMWTLLFISFILAHSFSYSAAPAVFSFYPIALFFIFVYCFYILKRIPPIKDLLIGSIFFVLLHFFHLGPEVISLFDSGGALSTSVFGGAIENQWIPYFYGVIGFASLAKSIMLVVQEGGFWQPASFFFPFIVFLGFFKNSQTLGIKKYEVQSKTFLLTALVFLLTLFLISAKITHSSIKLYEAFFLYVPGFGMFRNFYIQWMFVYTFLYTILFGQALYLIFSFYNKKWIWIILSSLIITVLIVNTLSFIKGDQFGLTHFQSDKVRRLVKIDSRYEDLLSYIRNIPDDGKILQFPFSDFNFQVVHGINDGAYVGTSTIGQLTGVKDFSGYWHVAPFSESFLQLSKEKKYSEIKRIIGLLNIRYILHNFDSKVYDTTFPGRPFEYVKQYLPSTQNEYEKFIKPLTDVPVFETGPYKLFSVPSDAFLPHFYIPKETFIYNYNSKYDKHYNSASSFLIDPPLYTRTVEKKNEQRVAFIEKDACNAKNIILALCNSDLSFTNIPFLYFKKINPTKYVVSVTKVEKPFILVFSDSFHKDWKVFISKDNTIDNSPQMYFDNNIVEGKSENIFFNEKTFETFSLKHVSESQHFSINGYANAWYIRPEDVEEGKGSFIIEMTGQRLFYITFLISVVSFFLLMIWGIMFFVKRYILYAK